MQQHGSLAEHKRQNTIRTDALLLHDHSLHYLSQAVAIQLRSVFEAVQFGLAAGKLPRSLVQLSLTPLSPENLPERSSGYMCRFASLGSTPSTPEG